MHLISRSVVKFGRALGPTQPLPALELQEGVSLGVVGQPFSVMDDKLWVLQFLDAGRSLQVSESVRVFDKERDPITLSHRVRQREEGIGNLVCSAVLGDELLRPRVRRFIGGPPSEGKLFLIKRNTATFWHHIYETFLFDIEGRALIADREYHHREDWDASV